MKKVLAFFSSILFSVNLFFLLLLFLAAAAPFISPEIFTLPAFFGLAFPYLYLIITLFFLYYTWRKKWKLFVSLAALILTFPLAQNHIQLELSSAKKSDQNIRLTSHNIRAFGLNGPIFEMETGNRIFAYYKNNKADIYCFQEFFNTSNPKFSPFDSMKTILGLPHIHSEFTIHFRGNDFGLATFSKYPIISKGIVKMEQQGTNLCIFTDLDVNGETIRVYNLHLASVHLKDKDYQYLKRLTENNETPYFTGAGSILTRLKNAFQKRSIQAETIAKHIKESPHPVMVCGDFNDTPTSYTYRTLKESKSLTDTFRERGFLLGSTYNGLLPALRIDYILVPEESEVLEFSVDRENLSDHFPIHSTIRLPSKQQS